ncbi:hypothetical protein Cgig2_014151 [Carnegiea gigantea]|uniref:Reverse transcriptase zinc-binding domain-containing protein n=1 Tax=Carnegiea gigantea TaxID=171969 RepID=A0A9Q1GSC8_9CARY|nr:hypothetical protein Cgig2_014151 [Carnegiea gigantea]
METIKKRCRYYNGVADDTKGCSRSVALLWKKDIDVSLMPISLHHIDVTDHLPIQLKLCSAHHTPRHGGRKRFKFENMWALHDECLEIVKGREKKIKECTVKLATSNRTEFGHVQSKIQALELALQVDFLRNGDSNLRWLYTRASTRRAANHITPLLDESGQEKNDRIFQAKYFPNCSILDVRLGYRPSFTWRSMLGACDLIKKGARWLIVNEHSISVWSDPWLSRPYSFMPVHPPTTSNLNSPWKVVDLIDHGLGTWKESVIKASFIPCDVELILSISCCPAWPNDMLIWNFSSDDNFTVRSAYHLARSLKNQETASSSALVATNLWSKLWALNIPPIIKIFRWKVAIGALVTRNDIAKRIRDSYMSCHICGTFEDSTVYTLPKVPPSYGNLGCEPISFRAMVQTFSLHLR